MTNTPPTTFGGLERPAALALEHAPGDPRGTVEGSDPPSLHEVTHLDGPAEVVPSLTALVRVCSGASIGLGLAVLAGWMFGIGRLKSVVSGMTSMTPPTAIASY